MKWRLAIALLVLSSTALRSAAETETVSLAVTPAALPRPALKYRLWPAVVGLKRGNAAILYYRAALQVASRGPRAPEYSERQSQLLELPPDKLPIAEAQQMLDGLPEFVLASNYRDCAWDTPADEFGIETVLPELDSLRELARRAALKTRIAVAKRDYAEAAETARAMFRAGRRLSESGTLVGALVGVSISSLACREVEHWIGTPGSPNLYVALTDLPTPFVSLRPALEAEPFMLATLPYRELLEQGVLSQQQADELWRAALELFKQFDDRWSRDDRFELRATAAAVGAYPLAKQILIERGRKPSDVEAMPVAQAILSVALDAYQDLLAEGAAWSDEPYYEAAPALDRLAEQIETLSARPEGWIARGILPAIKAVTLAGHRLQQRIDALRIVEALRLHAATHGGRLPETLANVDVVPLPLDPMSGKPFEYRLEGDKAILIAPAVPLTYRYEITIAGKTSQSGDAAK